MEIPENNPIADIFKKLFNMPEPNPETWTQAGKISSEDLARRRGLFAKADEIRRDVEALEARVDALKAGVNADSKEWWAYVYKQYGLPSGDYSILEDGRIMRRPKDEK